MKFYIAIISVFVVYLTSDAMLCDIYNVDEVLYQPVNDGFLGWNLLWQWV